MTEPCSFALLLVPQFPIYVLTLVTESLRLANKCLDREAYQWPLLSIDGKPVPASNGMWVTPDAGPEPDEPYDVICILAGYRPEQAYNSRVQQWLKRQAGRGCLIGGIDTGAFILTQAGLLKRTVATVHWEASDAFRETFPHQAFSESLYHVEFQRFTCAGGTASLDLMLHLISSQHGPALAQRVTQDFIHDQVRPANDRQISNVEQQWLLQHPRMADAIRLMENNLEEPLSATELARGSGMSKRQLERAFLKHFETSLMLYYRRLRLNRAHNLVLYSEQPLKDIALATGFRTQSSFSHAYQAYFRQSPRQQRQQFHSSNRVLGYPDYRGGMSKNNSP